MQKLEVANVLAEQSKKMGKVFSHDKFDVLNIQLKQGEAIPEHSVNNVAVIIVRKGTVHFDVEGKEVMLTDEDVLIMEPLEMHSLKAITDVDIVVLKL
ncbi:cupin domain-containing protein [Metasolibacillus meyeri]|uniref:Cupin domain-containing protein n=1 Tax=Metasolibacillus meyeri TaxID=1071052 RepID=A0AAW9NTC9_9BACL|nr:cupin domain-containing protein [Metasolibacillus meyeri]MEC1179024.1 cupin domain-containing protein [Metasolibacillus meyeri]